jgi:ribosome-binding protein aMBF1 (putative translation factor)
MSRIPIKDLKELANKNGQDIVIVFGADTDGHTTHVATWGRSIELCDRAARWGNNMKKQLGWPESLTKAEPSRVRKLQAKIKELETQLEKVNP